MEKKLVREYRAQSRKFLRKKRSHLLVLAREFGASSRVDFALARDAKYPTPNPHLRARPTSAIVVASVLSRDASSRCTVIARESIMAHAMH
jgi:hypothetical protein